MMTAEANVQGELQGWSVVVTRPSAQAEGLCQRIEEAGGVAMRLPLLDIERLTSPRRPVAPSGGWDWILFVSVNAVALGAEQVRETLAAHGRLATVGRATAQALRRQWRDPDVVPAGDYSSEGLLNMPALQSMEGQNVLIVRGEGGRELLAQELRARGATVEYAEVYRRRALMPEVQDWARVLRALPQCIFTATSNEILVRLWESVPPEQRGQLVRQPLVVVGARVLKLAHELGFSGPCLSTEPGDRAMVETMAQWISQQERR